MLRLSTLTPRSLVDLVLDEEIYHGNNGGKKSVLCHKGLVVDCERGDKRCGYVFSV